MLVNSSREYSHLRWKFCIKLVLNYFAYGYLFIILIALSLLSIVYIIQFGFPYALASLLLLYPAYIGWIHLVRIVASTKTKWKFYKVNYYRLSTRAFSEKWFDEDMYEPCMRLIIRDLCHEFGYINEYHKMYSLYAHRDMKIERAKEAYLEKLKNQNTMS